MKSASFSYRSADSLEETVALLAELGDSAKILAGGQSLVPLMNFRLARPSVVIDVNKLSGLDRIASEPDELVLGSMLRQSTAERSVDVARDCPLLHAALPYIAHRAIRNRGTIGGSIAHADPAAELPAVALALGAEMEVASTRGMRTIAAEDFFLGYLTTALADDEVITSLRFPYRRTGTSWLEFAPRPGDFAIVGLATVLDVASDGSVKECRLVCCGIADRPVRLTAAEACIVGGLTSDDAIAVAATAAATEVDPISDHVAGAGYRRNLVSVLVRRGITAARARPTDR